MPAVRHNAHVIGRHVRGALVCCVLINRCGGTATAPDERHGSPVIIVRCESGSASALMCTAPVSCSGLYPCQPGTPADVTATATWTTDDPTIAEVTGVGIVAAVAP